MDLLSILMLIAAIIPAASYGWGMRGTTIGGEKGAMLPGALIGAFIAINSDILIVKENFFIFAALGAIGMYFGGCMTYGETLGLSMSARPATELKRGLQGVALKGFLWFGVFGSVFSTGTNAVCKVYSPIHLVVLFILTPALALLMMKICNRPYNVDEFKFPKFYFSKKRPEYWGAMLGILLSFMIINIISLNLFGIIFPLICALFGGVGWVIGQLMQIYSIHYAKYSRHRLIRVCFSNKNIDSWKLMECVLGAFGGLGAAVSFIITYPLFKNTVLVLETNNGLQSNNILSIIVVIIWLILIALDMLQYIIKRPVTKDALRQKLKENTITRAEFMVKNINAVDTVPKFYDYYEKSLEPIEFVLYAALPFVFISLGSSHTSIVMTVYILMLVMLQEIVFENEYPKTLNTALQIIFCILTVGLMLFTTVNHFILHNIVSFKFILVLYTLVYEVLSLVLTVYINTTKNGLKSFLKSKSTIINNVYFMLCSIFLLITADFVTTSNVAYIRKYSVVFTFSIFLFIASTSYAF